MANVFESFRETSPGRQVALVAGVSLVVLVALSAAWFAFMRTDYRPVFTDLQPEDASIIVGQLEKEKIAYRLGGGGSQISVPEEQADAARVKVMGAELPFRGTVGLELFNKSDMGMTDFAQKINYQRALQGELARTIMAIDGVDSARVHLALGEDRVFRDDRVPPKASVMVRMRANTPIQAAAADGIRRLVAASIDQLEPSSVVILDEHGALVQGAAPLADRGVGVSPLVAERQATEDWYVARIRQAVSPLAGPDEIEVAVSADIDRSSGDAGQNGNPVTFGAARTFALQVTLAPRDTISAQKLDEIRKLTRQAIGYDAAKGDAIVQNAWLPQAQLTPSAPYIAQPAPIADPSSGAGLGADVGSSALKSIFGLAAGIAAIVSLFLLVRRRQARAGLAATDRIAFADRLNTLLVEDTDGHRHGAN